MAPGFYAKWERVHDLAGEGRLALLGLILFGALLEAGYLFRWFGYAIKRERVSEPVATSPFKRVVILAAVAVGWGLGYLWGALSPNGNLSLAVPLLFSLRPRLPRPGMAAARVKNSIAIAGMVAWFVLSLPGYDPLQLIFAAVMLIGGALILLASYWTRGRRIGFYPSAMLMYAGLAMLIVAEDSFNFFAAWESLTVGSYFLILRGKRSGAPRANLRPVPRSEAPS